MVKVPDPLLLLVWSPLFWFKRKGHQILPIIGTLEVTYIYISILIYVCVCVFNHSKDKENKKKDDNRIRMFSSPRILVTTKDDGIFSWDSHEPCH